MVVTFLRTIQGGKQEIIGHVVLNQRGLVIDGAITALADWLLRDVDRADLPAVEGKLRQAATVFDGTLIRAKVSTHAPKFNPNHDELGRFASGPATGLSTSDTEMLLRYGAHRLSPPQFAEYAETLVAQDTAHVRPFWMGKAREWLEWLQEDPTLLDFAEPAPLNGETYERAMRRLA